MYKESKNIQYISISVRRGFANPKCRCEDTKWQIFFFCKSLSFSCKSDRGQIDEWFAKIIHKNKYYHWFHLLTTFLQLLSDFTVNILLLNYFYFLTTLFMYLCVNKQVLTSRCAFINLSWRYHAKFQVVNRPKTVIVQVPQAQRSSQISDCQFVYDFLLTFSSNSVLIKQKVREAASQLSPGRLGSGEEPSWQRHNGLLC